MAITASQIPDGLPPGRLIVPDLAQAGTDQVTEPVLWISEEPLGDEAAGRLWADLLVQHAETGLWPLLLGTLTPRSGAKTRRWRSLLGTLALPSADALGRPWFTGELSPVPAAWADEVDVDELFANGWERFVDDSYLDEAWRKARLMARTARQRRWLDRKYAQAEAETGGPTSSTAWLGPAPGGEPGIDPDQRAIALATNSADVSRLLTGTAHGPHLGLVAAADGADAISACGWRRSGGGGERGTAVLRSWQRRFGVRLCSLSIDTLNLSVAWPPRTAEHARRVAMEHHAFCPDLAQDNGFDEYAAGLVDATVWSLWWD